jgi:hypothetical protein
MIKTNKISTNNINKLSSEMEQDLTLLFKAIQDDFFSKIDNIQIKSEDDYDNFLKGFFE